LNFNNDHPKWRRAIETSRDVRGDWR
jgi:hypothetical protein